MASHLTRAAAVAALLAPAAGLAQTGTAQLSSELSTAQSILVFADTNPVLGIGTRVNDPRYLASGSPFSGVVNITVKDSAGVATNLCSGTLLSNRSAILTAAHCVARTSGPGMGNLFAGQVDLRFRNTSSATDVVLTNAAAKISVKPGYTGNTVETNDLAVILLDQAAPAFATGYGLFSGDPFGVQATFSGWGRIGDGNTGDLYGFSPPGGRRQGLNEWEASRQGNTLYDADFFASQGILVYDFDNGSADRNILCQIFGGAPGSNICDTGEGVNEVGLGRGDSGGPGFINVGTAANPIFQIAGVASWVTNGQKTGGTSCNDATTGVSCFGAFGGHTDVQYGTNAAWIATAAPEPGTWALLATGLVGVAGVAARRRRTR